VTTHYAPHRTDKPRHRGSGPFAMSIMAKR
jgi:hypothetical protein